MAHADHRRCFGLDGRRGANRVRARLDLEPAQPASQLRLMQSARLR